MVHVSGDTARRKVGEWGHRLSSHAPSPQHPLEREDSSPPLAVWRHLQKDDPSEEKHSSPSRPEALNSSGRQQSDSRPSMLMSHKLSGDR